MHPYNRKKMWFVTAMCLMVMFTLGLSYINYKSLPALVVIDMNRAVQAPSIMLAHSTHSVKTQEAIIQRFSRVLPLVIKEYGAQQHVTIISASVITHETNHDVTDKLIELTLARMMHEAE